MTTSPKSIHWLDGKLLKYQPLEDGTSLILCQACGGSLIAHGTDLVRGHKPYCSEKCAAEDYTAS